MTLNVVIFVGVSKMVFTYKTHEKNSDGLKPSEESVEFVFFLNLFDFKIF